MKDQPLLIEYIFILVSCIFLSACKDEEVHSLPELETLNVTEITQSTAKSGGNVTSNGGGEITSRGVCWDITTNPSITDFKTIDGSGIGTFVSNLNNLDAGTTYYLKAYATNNVGTSYGNEVVFSTMSINPPTKRQIIADHTIIEDFDKIPHYYLDLVKKMWIVVPGESHSQAYRTGLKLLEASYPAYSVSVVESGTPEPYTDQHLRASRATWGDYLNNSGWIYDYGEEDWWTNSTGRNVTNAGITYCNTHDLIIGAIGFGWCWDHVYGGPTASVDPVFGCHWYGTSNNSPSGDRPWGLDSGDQAITGNSVSMDTYLSSTQEYIDQCTANGYTTRVFFTTGPVDTYYAGESGYQAHLKHEHIRNYVLADTNRVLFDYADILCYDDNGTPATSSWNGHTFPIITSANSTPEEVGHISNAGAIRLAKAQWWMLARIAGWDGN